MVLGGVNHLDSPRESERRTTMEHGVTTTQAFGLPEDRDDEFDARALEEAIRNNRRREFDELAHLNA
jgi:hypothetical protein